MMLNETVIFHAAKNFLKGYDNEPCSTNLVVTATRLNDGRYIELSRFDNSVWRLPDALFPTYTKNHEKELNFDRAPPVFRYALKVMVLRFYLYGMEGSVRPRGATVRHFYSNAVLFLRFLDEMGISRLDQVNTLLTSQYVDVCCSKVSSQTGKRLGSQALNNRFMALEMMCRLSSYTLDPMVYPWPEASAAILSGVLNDQRGAAKTHIIPDAVLAHLFSQAHTWLENAEQLLDHRDRAKKWQHEGLHSTTVNKNLEQRGYRGGLRSLNNDITQLQEACLVIVLTTSGIRVSELGSLRFGCAYTTVGDDGEHYHWMRGYSDKTGEGETSWLVPAITHTAIRVAERIAEPRSKSLQAEINRRLYDDPNCVKAASLMRNIGALFPGRSEILSGSSIRNGLKHFAKARGLNWNLTPHQFRRTFAVYAARSAYGDLRYLKEHFKHWSLDMTALYTLNERQDAELYNEMLSAMRDIKVDLLEYWLDSSTPVGGGLAEPIKDFRHRHQAVKTYSGRRQMAERLSDQVSIRSTGVAWCTADFGGCNGGQGFETTRCGDCQQSIIDDTRQSKWEGLYAQQIELRQINDIGPSGQHRVERDIARCRKVLSDLGADPERLSRHG